MTPRDYEIAVLAQTAWRLASTDNQDEILAIACTIRNWVLPRPGMPPMIFASFSVACENYLDQMPLRSAPRLQQDLAFSTGPHAILRNAAAIYDGEYPDVTALQGGRGARYFGRQMDMDPNEHPLLGTWGGQQFYA